MEKVLTVRDAMMRAFDEFKVRRAASIALAGTQLAV
jgi:hypothetical protein